MNWLKNLLISVWIYLSEDNRTTKLTHMINKSRDQTKSDNSNLAIDLKIVNPPKRNNIKIKKKRKANE